MDWYGKQADIETRNVGSLAVICPLIERMGVREIIDRHIPSDPQAEFTFGTTLSLLMAARFYSPRALMNVGEWCEDSGAEFFFGMPPEKANDDRLGRALDAFFKERHSILANLALRVAKEFDIPLDEIHYDPTHILFSGGYQSSRPRPPVIDRSGESTEVRSDSDLQAAHITQGRAMDNVPRGTQMTHVGLGTYVDELGPLPLYGHTIDGNQNGRTSIDEYFGLMLKHAKPNKLTLLSDRGTFSVGHLLRLEEHGFYAICSAPWGDLRDLFDKQYNSLDWYEASFLSVEQQRRRECDSSLPLEHYEIASVPHQLCDSATKQEVDCRVVFVFSTADKKVAGKQRQKQVNRIHKEMEKCQKNVARRGTHSDEASVAKRMARVLGKSDAARYFTWTMTPIPKSKQAKRRVNQRGSRIPTHEFTFTCDEQAMRAAQAYDGYSAIVTTVPKKELSDDDVFTKFKQQTYSELVNKEFKGPLAVSPIFLKTPERVEALTFLLIAVLMLYYLLQRLYRKSVPEDASKKVKRTTTRTILRAFDSYSLLIKREGIGRQVMPSRPNKRQRAILNQLGFDSPAQLLSKKMPRAPAA